MRIFSKIFSIVGILCIVVSVISIFINTSINNLMFSLLFFFIGVIFGIICLPILIKNFVVNKKGVKYKGKIINVEEGDYLLNNKSVINIDIAYFNKENNKQITSICTDQTNPNLYGIGQTISFIKYKNNYILIKESLNEEILENEDILMSSSPYLLHILCPYCGTNVKILRNKGLCQYCGNRINLK